MAGLALAAVPGLAPAQTAEWNIARVHGPVDGAGVVVAVVDTGVDASHPTFGGRVLPAIDLVGGEAGTGDPHGHGTHVAGIVAGGATGPGIGVARGASILPVRVLGPDGQGSMSIVDQGIRRAADAGAAVINLSLSDGVVLRSLFGSSLADAINYAWGKGSIAVLAAGNHDFLGGLLGSGYGNVPAVVVTATGSDDRLASYATAVGNAKWGIAAPGGDSTGQPGQDVLSSIPGGSYGLGAGTSMAAPHASATLAALRGMGLSPADAVATLLATARPIGSKGTYGAGLVDASAAPPAPVATASPVPTDPAPAEPVPAEDEQPSTGSVAPAPPSPTANTSTSTSSSAPAPSSAAPSLPGIPSAAPNAARSSGSDTATEEGRRRSTAVLGLGSVVCMAAWTATIAVSKRLRLASRQVPAS